MCMYVYIHLFSASRLSTTLDNKNSTVDTKQHPYLHRASILGDPENALYNMSRSSPGEEGSRVRTTGNAGAGSILEYVVRKDTLIRQQLSRVLKEARK